MTERMKTGGLAAIAGVALAAAGLVGCSHPGPGSAGDAGGAGRAAALTSSLPNCPPAQSLNINQISVSGKQATIKLKDPRPVPASGAGLRWKLSTNGFSFTADGIAVTSPPAGATSASTGTEFQWCFGATPAGSQWKYSINFFADDDPSTVFTCDPTIISSASLMGMTDEDSTLTCRAP